MTRIKKNTVCKLLFISVLLSSCAGIKNASLNKQLLESNCNQQNIYTYTQKDIPAPIYEINIDTSLSSRFSAKSLNIANAIGVLAYLHEYVTLKKENDSTRSLENKIRILDLSQKINQRINVSSLEISAVTSEIDCEEERADQIANYLKGKEDEAEKRYTVGAIVVGAVGAIVTGMLIVNDEQSNAPDLIGIGAGLAETTLGLAILFNNRIVTFYHPRNALAEIWEGKEISTIFPVPVWYYLNYYNPAIPSQPSMRYQILDRWMKYGQISEVKTKHKKDLLSIYFGDGGKYNAGQLYNRANMLDQVEAHINLMKQDLKGLALELENLK